MSGFESLKSALDVGTGMDRLEPDELAFADQKLADETALKIVLQDVQIGASFLNEKALPVEWNNDDELYRAYVPLQKWPSSEQFKAHLSMPAVLEAIETILPQVYLSFFSDEQPFILDATGKTSPAAARAISCLVKWAIKQSGFKEEIRKGLKSALQYGQCIFRWGWENRTYKKKVYSKSDNGQISSKDESKEIAHPVFEWIDLREILVDPSLRCHDIRFAGHTIRRVFVNADQLDDLRSVYKNIPTREQLTTILAAGSEATENSLDASQQITYRQHQAQWWTVPASADPLKQPLEIIEWESDDRCITVLQRKIVIGNEENEFGRKSRLSCAFIDVLGAFYGFGIGLLLSGEQKLQTGVANAWIDSLNLSLNPAWNRKSGIGTASENVSMGPGRVINKGGELEPIPVPDISQSAMQAIEASKARAARIVGSNSGPDMPSQAMRTSEGVQQFTSGVQVKLQYFVDMFSEMVFIPAIEAFIELCKENLSPDDINAILSEEDGKAYQADILEVYNGTYSVDVLDSTKLAARRAMAAMLPSLMQFVSTQPLQVALAAQSKKFDWVEFLNKALEVVGWPSQKLIVDATPEDIQRFMQMQPGVAQAQAAQQVQQQKHQADLENIEQKGVAQAGVQVVRHILKQSESPEPAGTAPLVDALQSGGNPSGPQGNGSGPATPLPLQQPQPLPGEPGGPPAQ